ncbi:hypothetical protein M5D96_001927 [Drosophila gunungcola]|uniref:Uncharacterized protein n=1 Tax=Drosophila gunungcola TaxID=103775 RepID=A0A9P9YZU3_9MUSC|nr:hypothetical protein M5D96_001927 [Drosophila gunungcola]
MTAPSDLRLLQRQRLSGGNANLPLNQICACNHLRDGMLDLQAGVHLHKVEGEVLLVQDELHGACSNVAHSFGSTYSGLAQLPTQFFR